MSLLPFIVVLYMLSYCWKKSREHMTSTLFFCNCLYFQNTKDNPPCNTLFIGNLGENINEDELRGLFSVQPGYKQMKILRQERHTVCFIEFEDVNSATNVHQTLQGAVIPSSGSVGMRIQYSKNPFGRRKDAAGVNGTHPPLGYQ